MIVYKNERNIVPYCVEHVGREQKKKCNITQDIKKNNLQISFLYVCIIGKLMSIDTILNA